MLLSFHFKPYVYLCPFYLSQLYMKIKVGETYVDEFGIAFRTLINSGIYDWGNNILTILVCFSGIWSPLSHANKNINYACHMFEKKSI